MAAAGLVVGLVFPADFETALEAIAMLSSVLTKLNTTDYTAILDLVVPVVPVVPVRQAVMVEMAETEGTRR